MRALKWIMGGVLIFVIGAVVLVGIGSYLTERDIEAFQDQVKAIAHAAPFTVEKPDPATAGLPVPVQRYFAFAFPYGVPESRLVRLTSKGQFRRPLTEEFNATTAEQVIAIPEPALMFSATTPVLPGVWARAYDYFAKGEMEMKAKVLSLLTVVNERETLALNVISLRRWLLESALFPQALLPGGAVRWEAIDDTSARAVVEANGLSASMVAHFDETGRMTHMEAEKDGDLTTPYHGSGEHVTRSDYRDVGGVMIPHRFIISRMAKGKTYPFFDAELTSITFE